MKALTKINLNDDYINQYDVINRYLHNQLTNDEVVIFEEYILDKPALLERLELDSIMVDNLPKVEQFSANNNNQGSSRFSFITSFLSKASTAWAACVSMAALLTIYVSYDLSGGNEVYLQSPNIVYLEIVRGDSTLETIYVNDDNRAQIFALEIGAKVDTLYDLKIENIDNTAQEYTFVKSANEEGLLVIEFKNGLAGGKYKVSAKENGTETFIEFFNLHIK